MGRCFKEKRKNIMLAFKSCWACVTGKKFAIDLSPPKDVEDLFIKYSENNVMSPVHLQKFLIELQGESKTEVEVEAVMNNFLTGKQKAWDKLGGLKFNLDDFFCYLFDENLNPVFDSKIHHDMNLPMSHYFIFTGHNSYLTGNQLSSNCSEKPIIKALNRGVRVIELDLWPNPTKDNILVLHGRTLTKPVEFDKCILAIKNNAFVRSKYPVVITFEDHLPAPLQAKAARIVHEILGDIIYTCDPNEEGYPEFPSPESLKNRILISTKPPKEYMNVKNDRSNTEAVAPTSFDSVGKQTLPVEEEGAWGEEFLDAQAIDEISEYLSEEESEPESQAPEYKKIISIRAFARKRSLKDSLCADGNAKRVSLSEPELSKAAKEHPESVISFTRKHLLRVYPKGIRVDSSNYNPLKAWAHGAQMVALNMQGYGRPLWLVHGLFRANGGCGYVKKPDFLMKSSFNPSEPGPVQKTLKVKVFKGEGWREKFGKTHFDQFSPPDFYARIGIAGVKADTVMYNTKKQMDSWTPVWNEEFKYPLTVPELALLRVEVHEYDAAGKDDFGGQTCLPVSELKSGIRTVPLYDKKGNPLSPVKLLMRISYEFESIP